MNSEELRELVGTNNECCCEDALANKCKEFACDNDYVIVSWNTTPSCGAEVYTRTDFERDIPTSIRREVADTESDAVFLATQWVFENLI